MLRTLAANGATAGPTVDVDVCTSLLRGEATGAPDVLCVTGGSPTIVFADVFSASVLLVPGTC
jgi:hypothetical protein